MVETWPGFLSHELLNGQVGCTKLRHSEVGGPRSQTSHVKAFDKLHERVDSLRMVDSNLRHRAARLLPQWEVLCNFFNSVNDYGLNLRAGPKSDKAGDFKASMVATLQHDDLKRHICQEFMVAYAKILVIEQIHRRLPPADFTFKVLKRDMDDQSPFTSWEDHGLVDYQTSTLNSVLVSANTVYTPPRQQQVVALAEDILLPILDFLLIGGNVDHYSDEIWAHLQAVHRIAHSLPSPGSISSSPEIELLKFASSKSLGLTFKTLPIGEVCIDKALDVDRQREAVGAVKEKLDGLQDVIVRLESAYELQSARICEDKEFGLQLEPLLSQGLGMLAMLETDMHPQANACHDQLQSAVRGVVAAFHEKHLVMLNSRAAQMFLGLTQHWLQMKLLMPLWTSM